MNNHRDDYDHYDHYENNNYYESVKEVKEINDKNNTDDLVWVQNPLYDASPKTQQKTLPEYVEQVLIEAKAEARFPRLSSTDNLSVDIPEFICYEPYILRFDRR